MAMTQKAELEALYEENQRLHRILAMIESKCREAIRWQWKTMYFAKGILKIMGVESDV